jgi:hypothetical protein
MSNNDLIKSEMIRMGIGRDVIPQMDIHNKLFKYSKTLEKKKRNHDKVSPQKGN